MRTRLRRRGQNVVGSVPSAAHMPSFHGTPRGTSGQRSRPSTPGLHAGPHVDERVAGDEHVRVLDGGGEAQLLGARHEVIDEHAEAPCGTRGEPGDGGGQVVDAVHRLDDDGELAEVVAPDVLDQLGVVAALDPDPAGGGDRRSAGGAAATDPDAVSAGALDGATVGRRSVTGRPSSRKPPGFQAKWRWC